MAAAAFGPAVAAQQSDTGSLAADVDRNEGYTFELRPATDTDRSLRGSFDLDRTTLSLDYHVPANDSQDARSVNATMALSGLYEYRDLNKNERFDLGDEVVSFDTIERGRFGHVEQLATTDPVEGFQATYNLENGGSIEYNIYVTPETTSLDSGRNLDPMQVAATVTLEDVETQAEGTQLALATRVTSDTVEHPGPETVQVRGDGADLLYAWNDFATIDDLRTPTQSTVIEQHLGEGEDARTEAIVVKSLQPGDQITYDESFTVEHTQSPASAVLSTIPGDPWLFALGLLAALVVVGGNAWAKLRHGESEGNV